MKSERRDGSLICLSPVPTHTTALPRQEVQTGNARRREPGWALIVLGREKEMSRCRARSRMEPSPGFIYNGRHALIESSPAVNCSRHGRIQEVARTDAKNLRCAQDSFSPYGSGVGGAGAIARIG